MDSLLRSHTGSEAQEDCEVRALLEAEEWSEESFSTKGAVHSAPFLGLWLFTETWAARLRHALG